MDSRYKIIDLLETDTNVSWWDENRSRINRVIKEFNNFQLEYQFDEYRAKIVKAKIKLCREYGKENNFDDWQYEILDKMEEFLRYYISEDEDDFQLVDLLDINTDNYWWDENRKKINEVIESFNNVQLNRNVDEYDINKTQMMIRLCKEYGEEHDFADWQFELLEELKQSLCKKIRKH